MIEFAKQDIKTAKERRKEMVISQKSEADAEILKIIETFNKIDSSTGIFSISIVKKIGNTELIAIGDYTICVDRELSYPLYNGLIKLILDFQSLGYRASGLIGSVAGERNFLGYAAVNYMISHDKYLVITIQW